MTQATYKFFCGINNALNNVRYESVNSHKKPFGFYENATLYYKTEFNSQTREDGLVAGLWIKELPVKLIPTWNPYYNSQTPDKLDENSDVILPIYLYNDGNKEVDVKAFTEVKNINTFVNQLRKSIYCVASIICDSIRYSGDCTMIFDVDNKKLLFLVTASNLDNLALKKIIHFYFDESIFRIDNIVNKFLRKVYAELFSEYIKTDIFCDSCILFPEICMGIPNIGYMNDWKSIGDGTFESQKEYIQNKIDTFINSYEQQKD